MPLIGDLTLFAPNTDALSSEVNANFAIIKTAFNSSAVLTDAPRTITVRHTYVGGLSVTGGTLLVSVPTTFSALLRNERPPGNELFAARTVGDTFDRLSIRTNGRIARGTGVADLDTFEVRIGTGRIRVTNQSDGSAPTAGGLEVFGLSAVSHVDTEGFLRSTRPNGSNYALQVRSAGQTEPNLVIRASGDINWFDGTSTDPDVRLRRSSQGWLELGGNLRVTGRLLAQSGMYNAGDSGTAKTINWANGPIQSVRMTGNCTFSFTGGNPGDTVALHLIQDGTGGRTMTFTGLSFGDHTPDFKTGANQENIVTALVTVQGYRASHVWRS